MNDIETGLVLPGAVGGAGFVGARNVFEEPSPGVVGGGLFGGLDTEAFNEEEGVTGGGRAGGGFEPVSDGVAELSPGVGGGGLPGGPAVVGGFEAVVTFVSVVA